MDALGDHLVDTELAMAVSLERQQNDEHGDRADPPALHVPHFLLEFMHTPGQQFVVVNFGVHSSPPVGSMRPWRCDLSHERPLTQWNVMGGVGEYRHSRSQGKDLSPWIGVGIACGFLFVGQNARREADSPPVGMTR